MFKAIGSILVFIGAIIMDVWIFQDFKPKYLIMIIPVTIYTAVLAWINTKEVIDDIANSRRKKTQASKTSTPSSYAQNFCVRDDDGTIWCCSRTDAPERPLPIGGFGVYGKDLRKKTSPEDLESAAYIQANSEKESD